MSSAVMWTIGALIVFLISHEGIALRLDVDAPRQTNTSSMSQYLLDLVCDSAKHSERLEGAPRAKTFMTGIGSIPVIVVETRNQAHSYSLQGAAGDKVQNVQNAGVNVPWEGWSTKNCVFQTELEKLAARDPNQLVVLADGGDMAFGGCNENQLRLAYRRTVLASDGASIILGAELGLYPNDSPERERQYDALEPRRRKVLQEFGFAEDLYIDRVDCSRPSPGPCSKPPRLKYVNGGFRMGPARDLLELHAFLCKRGGNEQDQLTQRLLEFPNKHTLDYTGSAVLDIWQFGKGILDVLQRDAAKHTLLNTNLGHAQCFVHGNGPSKNLLQELFMGKSAPRS